MTAKYNAENERLKRAYLIWMREAEQHGEQSLDAILKALHRFDSYNKFRPFRAFHYEQAVAFKHHLAEAKSERGHGPLSLATQHSTLAALKAFFRWLVGQPGFKRRFTYADAAYFSMARSDSRIAKTHREARVPSLEQVRTALAKMPSSTALELRDRAVFAFVLLTGARDGAIPSLRRKHLDLPNGRVLFDAREVRTKFSKTFSTWFFPVGDEVLPIIEQWATHLDTVELLGPDEPLFPSTKVEVGSDSRFRAVGLAREPWAGADPVRKIFRKAFEGAGLPYHAPHSVRKTLTQLGERLCKSPEEFKAWSQNLGHEGVLTTFRSYGSVRQDRQAQIIRDLAKAPEGPAESLRELRRALDKVAAASGL
ncbi:tyrosine-type recombinase/integrase [Reyranella sp.]|uniref:tyrosine-type recombinase/integrase n=1 Tax=Reyranella sp. TaxID=1929291 RepID=UPI003BAB9075